VVLITDTQETQLEQFINASKMKVKGKYSSDGTAGRCYKE
jgi:hypothetical protein